MKKRTVLVLDRGYEFKYMKSDIFDVIVVCLQSKSKKRHLKEGLNVVACFEDEYDCLPVAPIPDNYLIHSFDSDRSLVKYGWSKRQEILGKEISFWRGIFDKYQPDCIVNEVVTIEWMEVMAIEAGKRQIPYYRIALLPFDKEDVWVKNNYFDSRLGMSFWDNITPVAEDYEKAKSYINLTRGEGRKPYFIRQKQKSRINNFIRYVKRYIEAKVVDTFRRRFSYENHLDSARVKISASWCSFWCHKYDKLLFQEDVEYLFYPVHFEPEATIEYFSYFFNDQAMMIGRIAHSLKTNQKLIVKEHPQQKGVLMTKKYRDLKKKYSNLVYLPGDISSYEIYPNIKCLVTLSGTAGFESWICKRPVIVFGEVYYSDLPSIIQCESFKQLYDIIRNEKYSIADDDTILEYVAKLYHVIEDAFPVLLRGNRNVENCQNITKKIESLLMTD